MRLSVSRLDYVDQMLLASGWKLEAAGYLAPESFRKELAIEVGAGHVRRSVAIAAQVQMDEAFVQRRARELGRAA